MKTTRKYRRTLWWSAIAAGLLAFGLGTVGARSGTVTTDYLTVNQDATFHGNLEMQDISTGSVPTNGLIFYFSFDTNTTPVPDDSGNGHTGTVSGATWVTNGITGGAYSFDGSDDYITVPDSAAWDFGTNDFAFGIWVYPLHTPTAYTNRFLPFLRGTSSGSTFEFCVHWNEEPKTYIVVDDTWTYAVSDVPSEDAWTYILVTRESGTMRYYKNGVLDGSWDGVTGDINSANPIYIGGAITFDQGRQMMDGFMDEVRIYNRALSASEVQGLYLNDAHLTAGTARFETGVTYVKPLGDLSMGVYTNEP